MPRAARYYCGAARLTFSAEPLQVVYCHCDDCRRWTGAAAPAFAAFADEAVSGLNAIVPGRVFTKGVTRWNCRDCGSPLLGRLDYLPDQSWVPLGVIDDASDLAPSFHCFSERRHPWMLEDGLPGSNGTGRETLNEARP
jgi:hypothetical protein